MTRLNKNTREAIIANAIKKSNYAERVAALITRRTEWAEALRVESLGGPAEAAKVLAAEKEIKDILETLPKNVGDSPFNTNSYMYPNLGGCRTFVYFNGNRCKGSPCVRKVVGSMLTIAAGHPLVEEFHAIEKADSAASEYKAQLQASVSAMAYSVTTVEKLLKVWPEALELLPPPAAPAVQLPAVQLADLNAMIGLPTGGN